MGTINTSPQVINPGIDSTTYIYHSAEQPVPLAKYCLSIDFLTSKDKLVSSSKPGKKYISKNGENNFSVQYSDFVFVIIIFLFSMLAYVRFYGKSYYRRIITSIFNYSYSASFFKEKNLAFALNSNILLVVFYLCATLLLGVIENYFSIFPVVINQWLLLLINFLSVFLLLSFYKLTYRICGLLFGQFRIVNEYLFYFNNLVKISGIVFLILLLGAYFTSDLWKMFFIYLSLIISFLLITIKISRVIMVLFKNRFSLYYLILYFCALEILPLLLLIKIILLISESNSSYFSVLV